MASQNSAVIQHVVELPYLSAPAYSYLYCMLTHIRKYEIYERFFSAEFVLKHGQIDIYCNYDSRATYTLRELANLAWQQVPNSSFKRDQRSYKRYCAVNISSSFVSVSFFNWRKRLIAQVKFKLPRLSTHHDLLSIISEANEINGYKTQSSSN